MVELVDPLGVQGLGVEHRAETADVEAFVALAGVERFDIHVVPRSPRGMNTSRFGSRALLVNSSLMFKCFKVLVSPRV